MPRSRIINPDDDLHVRLGGRQGSDLKVRLPSLGKTAFRPTVKVIVKVGYMRAGRVKGYAHYIERDGTAGPAPRDGTTATQGYSGYIGREGAGEGGNRAELFTRAGQVVDREAFVERSVKDPRAWTMIVSPGDGLNMTKYVRELMAQVEIDLDKRLEWIAATHRNTKYTHSHILMRGKDREGKAFRLPKDYLSHGLRTRATEIAQLFRERGWTHDASVVDRDSSVMTPLNALSRAAERWFNQHAREGLTR